MGTMGIVSMNSDNQAVRAAIADRIARNDARIAEILAELARREAAEHAQAAAAVDQAETMAREHAQAAAACEPLADVFGEVISCYSTKQAIADGVLVDVDALDPGARAQLKVGAFRVYLTSAAFELCVAMSPAAERAGCDVKGRLWDVLWMSRTAMWACSPSNPRQGFALRCVTKSKRPSLVKLDVVATPAGGPESEPYFCIMLPTED